MEHESKEKRDKMVFKTNLLSPKRTESPGEKQSKKSVYTKVAWGLQL
jgi:hypothetical protein